MKLRHLLWLALFLIGAGYFGPWVWHKAAGLNSLGGRSGRVDQVLAGLEIRATAGDARTVLPAHLAHVDRVGIDGRAYQVMAVEVVVLALSMLLVFTPLPKYPELLGAFREPEFMLTFWATMVALVLSMLFTFFGARLPDRVEAILWIVIGVSAALFAPWMFGRAMPDIDRLYHYSIGWGIVAVVIGGVLMAVIGGMLLLRRNLRASSARPRRFSYACYCFSSVIMTDVFVAGIGR